MQGGWTALMWAAYKGRTDVAQMLLEKGANPNITGQVLRLDTLYFFFFPLNDAIIGIWYSLFFAVSENSLWMGLFDVTWCLLFWLLHLNISQCFSCNTSTSFKYQWTTSEYKNMWTHPQPCASPVLFNTYPMICCFFQVKWLKVLVQRQSWHWSLVIVSMTLPPLSAVPTVQRLPHYLGSRTRPRWDCPSPAAARRQGQLLR